MVHSFKFVVFDVSSVGVDAQNANNENTDDQEDNAADGNDDHGPGGTDDIPFFKLTTYKD